MSDGLNKVMLLGNLGQDPELRFTQGGQAVLNIRLATTETYFDRDRQKKERTEWHSVVVWGARAEALAKFLNKGMSIFVEGSIRNSSYEGKDGQKRYKTEISAKEIILTGRGGGQRDDSGGHERRDDGVQQQRQAPPAPTGAAGNYGDGAGGDLDDIPFARPWFP